MEHRLWVGRDHPAERDPVWHIAAGRVTAKREVLTARLRAEAAVDSDREPYGVAAAAACEKERQRRTDDETEPHHLNRAPSSLGRRKDPGCRLLGGSRSMKKSSVGK